MSKYGFFFWSIFSRIQSKYEKILTRKNSVFGQFSYTGNHANFSKILGKSERLTYYGILLTKNFTLHCLKSPYTTLWTTLALLQAAFRRQRCILTIFPKTLILDVDWVLNVSVGGVSEKFSCFYVAYQWNFLPRKPRNL